MGKTTYDIIKHQNGEAFARALRDNNLLDTPNIVQLVKFAGRDANPALLSYIWSIKRFETTNEHSDQDPFELLHRAGYEFVEYADTFAKQNRIKKYFRENEELCTFRDETRHQEYYIVNAVKYGADKIQPSPIPQRQDEYGTSVISIQMRKTGGFISIKNRYNHSVEYCDSTFDSNPDNIIAGLSAALKTRFNVNWAATRGALPDGYVRIGDNILKYTYEIHNAYIGENFYEQHGRIHELDKNSQTMLDYFIWDAKQQKLLNPTGVDDGFIRAFRTEAAGRKVTLTGRAPNQTLCIDGTEAIKLQGGRIVWLNFPNVENAAQNFLAHNTLLKQLHMENLKTAGSNFLTYNEGLCNLNLPRLEHTDSGFLTSNETITSVNLPNLKHAGMHFLTANTALTEISLPNLLYANDIFLANNNTIKHVDFPRLTRVGSKFMKCNMELELAEFPSLVEAGDMFLQSNQTLADFKAPKLQTVGSLFLAHNNSLLHLELPELTTAGDSFLFQRAPLDRLYLPKLQHVGTQFLQYNLFLKYLYAPMLTYIDNESLTYNKRIRNQILAQRPNALKRAMRKIQKLAHRQAKNPKISQEKSR